MKKILSTMLASTLLLNLSSYSISATESYSTASSWAISHIQEAQGNLLLNKADTITENLQKNITRGEFCLLIMNCFDQVGGNRPTNLEANRFSDVSNDNLDILHAYELGIVSGTSENTFSPDNEITRQELAILVQRTAEHFVTATPSNPDPDFADKDQIADWAKPSVAYAQEIGALAGTDQNEINPLHKLTCEQAVIVVNSFFKFLGTSSENTPEDSQEDANENAEEVENQPDSSVSQALNLEEFYFQIADTYQLQNMEKLETDGEFLQAFYPELNTIPSKQLEVYLPMMTFQAIEIALVEVENPSDVEKVKEIFQVRINNQIDGGAWYPETIEGWKNSAEIVTNGNYVMLIVHPEYQEIVDTFLSA